MKKHLFQLDIGDEFLIPAYHSPLQPPGDNPFDFRSPGHGPLIVVSRIDGMYRRVKDQEGNIYCFSAATAVEPLSVPA